MLISCSEFCRKQSMLLEKRLPDTSKLAESLESHMDCCPSCRSCFQMRMRIKESLISLDEFGRPRSELEQEVRKKIRSIIN